MEKFEFEGKTYFNVPTDQLKADKSVDFPLFAYMKLNATMVLCYSEKRTPSARDLDRYKKKGLAKFACPIEFYDKWQVYLKYEEEKPTQRITADTVKQALQMPLSQEQKKQEMTHIGHRMMNILVDIAKAKPEDKWLSFQECQVIADTIVQVGMQTHEMKTVYEDLIMMQQSKVEHSACVSTLVVVFGLIYGFTDEKELAELSLGGLLHDVGHSLMSPAVVTKPISALTADEFKLYREHIIEGAMILEEFGTELPSLTRLIVMQHHERFDGTGFPNAIRGFEIDERVQLIHLADIVADYVLGRMTGKELDPADAFDQLGQEMKVQQFVSPQLFESISQAVRKSKVQASVNQKAVA